MENTTNSDQNLGTPPAGAWVRFLRSYGPTPNNLNLFDEFVTGALNRAKVQPIALSSPHLEAMKQRAASGAPGSILIAGTAGDGKTYHCRSLWVSLGGTAKAWSAPELVKTLDLVDGRSAVFVKDLSAYSDENRHQFQSNVGHYFQRKPCHLFRLNHSQSFHSKVGH